MTLIKSISGIRGTIGGTPGNNLTPMDIVRFTSAYAKLLHKEYKKQTVVIGRDGRISGEALSMLVSSTLAFSGIDVIDCGLSTTPSVEMAVINKKASGGVICTASHNPMEWNALKFLDHRGEFISGALGEQLVELADSGDFAYAPIGQFGRLYYYPDSIADHIEEILKLPTVDVDLLHSKKWHLTVDAINSTGALAIPALLDRLGIGYDVINGNDFGNFAHIAEPLPEHLTDLSRKVVSNESILGVAVDPDVDRLVLICEDGSPFGEEYTLVAVADYYLKTFGNGSTVSNLSSSMALADVTENHGGTHYFSAVGERHVVDEMKKRNAIVGGEGNGGIILPELHYGRDAVAGLAVFLTGLAKSGLSPSKWKNSFPEYHMSKDKIQLDEGVDLDFLLEELTAHYSNMKTNLTDGLKIYFGKDWLHIRKSNTEPILRIYAEAGTPEKIKTLTAEIKESIKSLMKKKQ